MTELRGEYLGTTVLILMGLGVCANNLLTKSKGENAGWVSITTGWAISVILGVFVAKSAGAPQGDINPAVTFAKYLLGGIYTLPEALKIMAAQCAGAFTGAIIVWMAYLPHWKITKDPSKKLAVFSTSPALFHPPSNLLSEIIGTAVLVIGVGAIFGNATAGDPLVAMGPYLVGMLVWGIGLSLGGSTGYAINPARDFMPRLAHALLPIPNKGGSNWRYSWIPVLGPFAGGALGAIIWKSVFS